MIVTRVTADKPGLVSVESRLKSACLRAITAKPGRLVMDGCWKGPIPGKNWLIAPVEGDGLCFQTVLLALLKGGRMEATAASPRTQGANAVTFVLTAATSFLNYQTPATLSGCPKCRCAIAVYRLSSNRRFAFRGIPG